MTDYAALIAEARRTGHFVSDTTRLEMTPSLFGKALVCIWAVSFGRSDFPKRSVVVDALFGHAGTAPADVRSAMHVDGGIEGDTIAEYDEYLSAARSDGLLSRLGRDRHVVEIDRRTAEDILATILRDRPQHRSWLDAVVRSIGDAGRA